MSEMELTKIYFPQKSLTVGAFTAFKRVISFSDTWKFSSYHWCIGCDLLLTLLENKRYVNEEKEPHFHLFISLTYALLHE